MEVTIRLTAALANRFTKREKVFTRKIGSEENLWSLIEAMDGSFPDIKNALITENRSIRDSINIYVNGENVRYLKGVNTTIQKGDVINIIPAAAAG